MTATDELTVTGGRPLRGRLRLPGDKGISHRALLFGAIAEGTSRVHGLAPGGDVASTRDALRALGVTIDAGGDDSITIEGHGFGGLRASSADLDCGNSGTTIRMLLGLLAGRAFTSVLTGDVSLSERPMLRVVEPLRALGAHIDGRDGGRLPPLTVQGGPLTGVDVTLTVASGQVKTALLLAGLQASGVTEVHEPAVSRDHTERMLDALGAPIERVDDRTVRVHAGAPQPFELDVPGDPSSAAFFVVGALITPGSELVVEDLLLNPGRIAFVELLQHMGASIDVREREARLGEPVGDLTVRASPLHGTTIVCSEAMIDEVPALAVAASFADGVTEFRGAAELRVKESDRIAVLEHELGELGVVAEGVADGLVVHGGRPRAGTLASHGDHRIAMAAAIAANAVGGESHVRGWESVSVSYPGFAADLATLTAGS